MHLVMFDIDGTLIESNEFDSRCFVSAVNDVLGISVDTDWDKYTHVTDIGILGQVIEESGALEIDSVIIDSVKQRFMYHLSKYMKHAEVSQIFGALNFLKYLSKRPDVMISLATGGWLESAQLKLVFAGIDLTDIPIASSSDHYSRIEIMKLSEQRLGIEFYESKTYFGDGAWDQQAALALGYNFVLVGGRIKSRSSIVDYGNIPEILALIGLK